MAFIDPRTIQIAALSLSTAFFPAFDQENTRIVRKLSPPSIETLDLNRPYEESPIVSQIIKFDLEYRGVSKVDANRARDVLVKMRESVRTQLIQHHSHDGSDLVAALNWAFKEELHAHFHDQKNLVSALLTGETDCDISSIITYDIVRSFGGAPRIMHYSYIGLEGGHINLDLGISRELPYFYETTTGEGYCAIGEVRECDPERLSQPIEVPVEWTAAQGLFEMAQASRNLSVENTLLTKAVEVCPEHVLSLARLGHADEAEKIARKLGGGNLEADVKLQSIMSLATPQRNSTQSELQENNTIFTNCIVVGGLGAAMYFGLSRRRS